VLPRQHIEEAIETVAFRFEFHPRFVDAHLVVFVDGHPNAMAAPGKLMGAVGA